MTAALSRWLALTAASPGLAAWQGRPRGAPASVSCRSCGRMMPTLDELGSYRCTCGSAHYADPAGQPSGGVSPQ